VSTEDFILKAHHSAGLSPKAYRIYADRLTAAAILTNPARRRVVRSVA
jgi:transcriptional regulator of heat shock response